MERTLLLWRRSSSSCSRIVGVIRAFTISVRFSLLATAVLAGCVNIPADEKYFSIEHGQLMFSSAMGDAKAHCSKMGMATRHLGTDRAGIYSVSRFECVPK